MSLMNQNYDPRVVIGVNHSRRMFHPVRYLPSNLPPSVSEITARNIQETVKVCICSRPRGETEKMFVPRRQLRHTFHHRDCLALARSWSGAP